MSAKSIMSKQNEWKFVRLPDGRVIDKWWDRYSQNWICQLLDTQGNQIGGAVIVGNKEDAMAVVLAHFCGRFE